MFIMMLLFDSPDSGVINIYITDTRTVFWLATNWNLFTYLLCISAAFI